MTGLTANPQPATRADLLIRAAGYLRDVTPDLGPRAGFRSAEQASAWYRAALRELVLPQARDELFDLRLDALIDAIDRREKLGTGELEPWNVSDAFAGTRPTDYDGAEQYLCREVEQAAEWLMVGEQVIDTRQDRMDRLHRDTVTALPVSAPQLAGEWR